MPNPPQNPLDDFDPNVSSDPWATYAPGRWNGGMFKAHKSRANALNAMANHKHGCILYEYVNGLWVERARFDAPPFRKDKCDSCGLTTMRPAKRYVSGKGYQPDPSAPYVNEANLALERRGGRGGRLVEPPNVLTLCDACWDGMGYGY